jgi:hypothetical protein
VKKGTGVDQLGNVHGPPGKEDWVKIHYKGRVKSSGKEFEDTYHREKPAHFQIKNGENDIIGPSDTMLAFAVADGPGLAGADETSSMALGEECGVAIQAITSSDVTWTTGLAEAAKTMLLGEKCVVTIQADYAYGSAGHKGSYGKVPPNEVVVLTCELIEINNHRRKLLKNYGGSFWGL